MTWITAVVDVREAAKRYEDILAALRVHPTIVEELPTALHGEAVDPFESLRRFRLSPVAAPQVEKRMAP